MIRHFVLFSMKPEVGTADPEWLNGILAKMSRIPSVRNLGIGRLLDPREEWYMPRMYREFEYAITMEFENEDGLYAYQTDPGHIELAQEIRSKANVKVTDFVAL